MPQCHWTLLIPTAVAKHISLPPLAAETTVKLKEFRSYFKQYFTVCEAMQLTGIKICSGQIEASSSERQKVLSVKPNPPSKAASQLARGRRV